jgi:hypothetical protein
MVQGRWYGVGWFWMSLVGFGIRVMIGENRTDIFSLGFWRIGAASYCLRSVDFMVHSRHEVIHQEDL